MKEIFNIIGKIITIIIVGLMVLLTFSIHWILKTWANLSMEELVYHLQVPLEGTNESMVTEYIKVCLIPAIIALLLVITGRKHFAFLYAVVLEYHFAWAE